MSNFMVFMRYELWVNVPVAIFLGRVQWLRWSPDLRVLSIWHKFKLPELHSGVTTPWNKTPLNKEAHISLVEKRNNHWKYE